MTAHPTFTSRRLGYVPGLDGLRAIAALLVVGFHARIPGLRFGNNGVDIFFALSGFLITSILLEQSAERRRVNFRRFYTRRALRLLPAYFSVVATCLAIDLVSPIGGTLKGAAASLFYLANWVLAVKDTGLGMLEHTWSLSIEEQFYLVWPALLAVLLRGCGWEARRVVRLVGLLVAGSWLSTLALTLAHAPSRIAFCATPTRGIELLIGCFVALVVGARGNAAPPVRWSPRASSTAAAAALLGLLALSIHEPFSGNVASLVWWPTIAALTCVVIVAALHESAPIQRVLAARPLVEIGKRSYGLYLWHVPIFMVVDAHLGLDTWPPRLLAMAVSAVVVAFSYRFIERPFLVRKDRTREARPPLVGAPAGAAAR